MPVNRVAVWILDRAGDGIRTHAMVAWEATALPLGYTRVKWGKLGVKTSSFCRFISLFNLLSV